MADHVTCPSNANAHPGMVDCNPTRRSTEEVRATKHAKAAAKAQVAMARKENIKKVAALENAAKHRAKTMDQHANDPVEPSKQAKARMTRKRPDNVDEGNEQDITTQKCSLPYV
jgi:hypothetical protein